MSFKRVKSNSVRVVLVGSPCSRCELLFDAIPRSVVLLVRYVMLQAHLSCVMKCGSEAQRCRGTKAGLMEK